MRVKYSSTRLYSQFYLGLSVTNRPQAAGHRFNHRNLIGASSDGLQNGKHMRIIKVRWVQVTAFVLCFPLVTLMAGCATTEPARYFQLDLKLNIDKKTYEVTYNWHCNEVMDGPNFGPGGILKARWVWSPPTYMVLRKVENGSVFLFSPPQYCGDDVAGLSKNEGNFRKEIIVVDSIFNPKVMEAYTQRRIKGTGQEVGIVSTKIRRLDKSAMDYIPSQEEAKAKILLSDHSHGYQSVSARIFPESIWKSDENLARPFSRAKGIMLSPLAPNENNQYNFFLGQRATRAIDFDWDAYTVPLFRVGNQWELTENSETHSALRFIVPDVMAMDKNAKYDIGRPPVAFVNYNGIQIEVQNSREIFDAERRLLIQFINEYRPYPWIGSQK